MPRDFDTWNTREKNFSQSPRKAFQERLMLVYLVFTCYWKQICCIKLSKPSPKLRSWATLLVYDATVLPKDISQCLSFFLKASLIKHSLCRYLMQTAPFYLIKMTVIWVPTYSKLRMASRVVLEHVLGHFLQRNLKEMTLR